MHAYFVFLQSIDFLDRLLRYDHQERLTAQEAMKRACSRGRFPDRAKIICIDVYFEQVGGAAAAVA